MVITGEIVWLVVLGVAVVAALLDALVITCMGDEHAVLLPIVLGQWVVLLVVGLVLSAILESTG